MAESSINVTPSGTAPVACFTQIQASGTVDVQQMAIVDSVGTGTASVSAKVDANGLHVVASVGTPKTSGPITATAIGSLAVAVLNSPVTITSGKTGTLQHGIFSATQPTLWQIVSVNNSGGLSTVTPFLTPANETFDFKPGSIGEVPTVQSTGTAYFRVAATNLSTNGTQTANAYATFFWAEN